MIPVQDDGAGAEILNQFLSSHRIVSIDRHFIADGPSSPWSLCVSFLPADGNRLPATAKRPARVDYRDILNDRDFALFAQLRTIRKQLAEAEGVPAYALFTNEHLAAMVQGQIHTVTGLQDLVGVGESRARKYGEPFLAVLRTSLAETPVDAA